MILLMDSKNRLHKGDSVRLQGQECIGEIVKITGRYATVAFETMEVNILLHQLEKAQIITGPTLSMQPATRILNLAADALSSFSAEIDLHGMPVHEALDTIDQWIDRASVLGHKHLKVIHGKGKGLLRKAVRHHLQSHEQVKRVIDQHPYPGGSGVTWLEVD